MSLLDVFIVILALPGKTFVYRKYSTPSNNELEPPNENNREKSDPGEM